MERNEIYKSIGLFVIKNGRKESFYKLSVLFHQESCFLGGNPKTIEKQFERLGFARHFVYF